jgi:hypothetical protein
MIFFTKNNYLGGKNSARFIPQRGVAAKRYATLALAIENHSLKIN